MRAPCDSCESARVKPRVRSARRGRPARSATAILLAALAGSARAVPGAGAPTPGARPATVPDLLTWLPRLDRVASLYRETALSFTCTERISWTDRQGRGRERRFEYVYIVDANQGLKDYRTDPSLRGDLAAQHEVHPRDYGVPRYVENGFSWIVLFRKSRWPDHTYEALGEGRALGHPAVRIAFHPIPPYRKGINEWEGEAWFDRETAQLLRVEARRPGDYLSGLEQSPTIVDQTPLQERISAEFKIAKNGMRFPALVRLEMFRVDEATGASSEAPALRVEQTYRNYRFFEVRTAADIHDRVFGDEPAPTGKPPSLPPAVDPPPP
jgi:hypothetical protein